MYPYYTGYVANMRLHSDDINGIRSLYGRELFKSFITTNAPFKKKLRQTLQILKSLAYMFF